MKSAFVLLVILFGVNPNLTAHQYFFGFAEMEYNPDKKSIEATIILSTHDFQDVLNKKSLISGDLERLTHDSLSLKMIETEILKEFSIHTKQRKIPLHIVDFELSKNGLILIYFEAQHVELEAEFEVEFTCLMEQFPEQQNKITYINHGEKQTAVFLKNKTRQKLNT